jgi:hypothetical protein
VIRLNRVVAVVMSDVVKSSLASNVTMTPVPRICMGLLTKAVYLVHTKNRHPGDDAVAPNNSK